MFPNPAQLPLSPVNSLPAAAVPISVGTTVGTGPFPDAAPAVPAALTKAASTPAAAHLNLRRATSEGYGVSRGQLVSWQFDRRSVAG